MAEALICDHCGTHAARDATPGWLTVAQAPEPDCWNATTQDVPKLSGHYCSPGCLASQAVEREQFDRDNETVKQLRQERFNSILTAG